MKTETDKSLFHSQMLSLNSPLLVAPQPLTCNAPLAQTGPQCAKQTATSNAFSCLLHFINFPSKKSYLIFFPHSKNALQNIIFLWNSPSIIPMLLLFLHPVPLDGQVGCLYHQKRGHSSFTASLITVSLRQSSRQFNNVFPPPQ